MHPSPWSSPALGARLDRSPSRPRASTFSLPLSCSSSPFFGAATAATAAPPRSAGAEAQGSAPAVPLAARSALLRGGSARSAAGPCRDARLSDFVYPAPGARRSSSPTRRCSPVERGGHMNVCGFGADPRTRARRSRSSATATPSHWRAALDVVAQDRGWRGLSIAHTSCPLSKAVRDLEGAARFQRVRRRGSGPSSPGSRAIPRSRPSSSPACPAAPASSRRRARAASRPRCAATGAPGAPCRRPSQRIVVIRDTPKMRIATGACVEPRARRPAGDPARAAPCRAARCSTATRWSSRPRGCPRAACAPST